MSDWTHKGKGLPEQIGQTAATIFLVAIALTAVLAAIGTWHWAFTTCH